MTSTAAGVYLSGRYMSRSLSSRGSRTLTTASGAAAAAPPPWGGGRAPVKARNRVDLPDPWTPTTASLMAIGPRCQEGFRSRSQTASRPR